jgi:chitin disaccharide deacetylase
MPGPARRLIVNADDFGASSSINHAVIQACQRGLLTTASLMVNGAAAAEAVALAKENPRLGVGLHLSLCFGAAALPPSEIPDLADGAGQFSDHPARTGFRYFANGRCRAQLEREVRAQFRRFQGTGLPLDHVNGHLHFHLHPTVLGILARHASEWGIRRMRVTRDLFWLNAKLARGRWGYRAGHAVIFTLLAAYARRRLRALGIRGTARVFGLLQNGRVDEAYVRALLPRLPAGDSELYSHPSLDEFKHEFDALASPAALELARGLGIQLIRYSDL